MLIGWQAYTMEVTTPFGHVLSESGSDEGIYAWLLQTMHLVHLGGNPLHTTGIIELGGASAQNVAHESLREALIKGDFSPAADSLHKEMYIDPCTPKGYLLSSKLSLGSMAEESKYTTKLQARCNFSGSRSAALMLLHKGKEKCSQDHCYLGSVFMPKLQGKFLATENFFYASKEHVC